MVNEAILIRTQNIPSRSSRKDIPFYPPDLALLLTLIGSNYPCLELIFMVPKVFEPLKVGCICKIKLKEHWDRDRRTMVHFALFELERNWTNSVPEDAPNGFVPHSLLCNIVIRNG